MTSPGEHWTIEWGWMGGRWGDRWGFEEFFKRLIIKGKGTLEDYVEEDEELPWKGNTRTK